MDYSVEQDAARRQGFANYTYRIYKGGQLVARFWHDFRGDENGVEFVSGGSEYAPLGGRSDFLQGGGPEPLTLTARAAAYLDRMLAR
jgi:hypothetical protein